MTTFAEDIHEGTWFPYRTSRFDLQADKAIFDPPAEDAAQFRIRSVGPFYVERQKGRKRQHQVVLNPASKAMERISFFEDIPLEQEAAEREDAFDYAITGIEGAFWDAERKRPIDCTRENKLKLKRSDEFMRFFNHCLGLLAGLTSAAEEDRAKN